MKHLLIIIFSVVGISTFSQVINNLVVFCNDGEPFTLIMNGERYNNTPQTKLRVTGLTLPKYKVTIIFENKKKKNLNTNLTFFSSGYECEFSLNKKSKRKYRMDYFTEKRIEGFDEEPKKSSGKTKDNPTKNTETQVVPVTSQTVSSTPTNTVLTGNGSVPNNQSENPVTPKKCDSPLTNEQFEKYKNEILKKASEDEKKVLANVLVESNCLLTSQVKQIIDVLVTDKAKFEFAKKAFPMTKDYINYSKLTEAFITAPVKDEFKKFLSNKK